MSQTSLLQHLNAEQVNELVKRYVAGEKAVLLTKAFNINCYPTTLYKHLPPEQTSKDCEHCGTQMVKPIQSKTAKAVKGPPVSLCPNCKHQEVIPCRCKQCKKTRKQAIRAKMEIDFLISQGYCTLTWAKVSTKLDANSLSAAEAISLICLIRCGGWRSEDEIGALETTGTPFLPSNSSLKMKLIQSLLNKGLIAPFDNSDPKLFIKINDEIWWHPDKVNWQLLLNDGISDIEQLEATISNGIDWPESWRQEGYLLWKNLAKAECREYWDYCVAQRKLPTVSETSLSRLFENLLQDFTVSQCYQLIWSSAAEAIDFKARKNIASMHAANYMLGTCQRRADRARAEQWDIKGYKRNFALPRSQLSYVLHDVFYRHGDAGFTQPISIKLQESAGITAPYP